METLFLKMVVSTVITLNTESEERFKHDLIEPLLELKAAKGTEATKEVFSKNTIDYLFDQLQLFLRERPGWLLIVDNMRDRSTTQRMFYKELPEPGTDRWGQGYMLVTTQVHPRQDGAFVKVMQTNRGMNPNDAKQLLCELVAGGKGGCDQQESERLVKKLEFLPLAIVAAGIFIDLKSKITTYTFADYLSRLEEENTKASKLYENLMCKESDCKPSLQTALKNGSRKTFGARY